MSGRFYCTGCPNDPLIPCCHMHPAECVEIMDCRCEALGITLRSCQPIDIWERNTILAGDPSADKAPREVLRG